MDPPRSAVGAGRRRVTLGQVRPLRIYLAATTFLYAAGVLFTFFPVRQGITLSNPTGGIIAVVLGVAALLHLAVRPHRPLPAVLAAIVATPIVMAFHKLTIAEFSCLMAAMFLAMHLRAFYRSTHAWVLISVLSLACLIGLTVAPAPKAATTYLIIPIAIVGAAEAFGVVARSLMAAACTDPLTGVLNRAGWEISCADLLARSRSASVVVTVIALDLDGFKQINDTHGHAAGDAHLVDRARQWSSLIPRHAVLARLGGDEFAACIAGRDRSAAQAFVDSARELTPDASIGSASAPGDTADLAELWERADAALYAEKGTDRRT
ncbi:diguanylate cyclase (GGDEF)-like protein [Mycolicibacterium iranicum]|uniref:Diguanylate cyclase (GGDEF)-like protein n=1 Tax=Mycolicibacterium iranicum TaxID=912594 RepID=A0A839Q454_MYCIR|nr:GGDEF domain-containing protein [Mycolicibacterium iranicum]MBB2989684.1 diguanylate cyclase (GGDEF)-like protein [Mycolicibacterium iranicum]